MTALPAVDPMDLVRRAEEALRHAICNHSSGANVVLCEKIQEARACLDVLVRADSRAAVWAIPPVSYHPDVTANKRAA